MILRTINQFDKYNNKCLELSLQYSCMFPLRNINFDQIVDFDLEEQQYLMECTVSNPLYRMKPILDEYSRSFLKKILNKLDSINTEIYEEIYIIYASLVNQAQGEDAHFYKHYYYKTDFNGKPHCEMISLKEARSFVSKGTTGLVTWPAAFHLVEYLIDNEYLVKNKNILELGSGVGFTGLALSRFLPLGAAPKYFTSTDCSRDVLDVLAENASANEIAPSVHRTLEFDWFESWSDDLRVVVNDCDVVIGADIVYDPVIVEVLVSVIKKILTAPQAPSVILSLTLRNKDTVDKLFSKLDTEGIEYQIKKENISSLFYYDKSCEIQIIHLFNKNH